MMAEEEKKEGVDITSLVDDSHKESKTLVLGGFITDDDGTKLQEEYENGTTLAIEMEEQIREIGTWPGFPNQPERRYKVKDGKKGSPEAIDLVEKMYYGVNRRSSSLDEKTEIQDKVAYDIARLNKYKLERDPEGVFGLDSRVKEMKTNIYGETYLFQDHYKDLKSRINVDFRPQQNASGGNKVGLLPSNPTAPNTPLKEKIEIEQVSRESKKEEISQQVIRQAFDPVTVYEKLTNKFPLGIPDIQYVGEALMEKGIQGNDLTKLINTYMALIMSPAPTQQLVEKFLDDNGISRDPINFMEYEFIISPPDPRHNGDITYLHFVENVDIGNEFEPEYGIDMDTVDNMRSPSSFLIMQAEKTLAVKYIDLDHLGLNRMLRNLISDASLSKLENIKNLSINKFEGKPSDPGAFRIESETIELLAKRFEKVTISNSLIVIDLPAQTTITTSNLTLEHCVIVGNNSTINVKGDLNLLDCTFESAKDDKKHFITFQVDGNVEASELVFKEDISIIIGTDQPDKKMNVRNVKYRADSVKEYSNLLVVGFKDLSVTGLTRVKGATPHAPMISIKGCTTVLLMDIDNKDASFDTLVEVEAFNDLTVMGVKGTPSEKFNTIVNISKSSEEAKIKLADFDVKAAAGGLFYRINGCKISTLKFDGIKVAVGDIGALFNNEIETVSFSDCDIHLSKPLDLFYDSKKLTLSSTQIVAPKISIPVPTSVHLDGAMVRADEEIDVTVKSSSRFSLMKSSLVTKKLTVKREDGATGDSVELTDSSIGGEGSKTALFDSAKVVLELSYMMAPETVFRNVSTLDIADTVIRVNTAKLVRLDNIENIKSGSFDLENGGSLTFVTVGSKGKVLFKVKSDVVMRRESKDSVIVDTHNVEGENKYKVTVISSNCISSAYLIDKKYFTPSLEGKDFRFFKSIDSVKMYSPQQSLNGKFKNILFGLPEDNNPG